MEGSKNGEEVLGYLHGLPDQTWHEPNPEDPLSLIDQVKDIALLSSLSWAVFVMKERLLF